MKKLPVAITEEEFFELMKHTKKKHHKLAFMLGFTIGLRISEIVNLQPANINLIEKKVFIIQGKGKKDRVLPIPKGFKEEYLKLIPIKCGVRALEKAFLGAAKRAGLLTTKPTLHFHSLRHGFASHLLKKGVDIQTVRFFMGHSNISTTSVYLQTEPTEALKKYNEMW